VTQIRFDRRAAACLREHGPSGREARCHQQQTALSPLEADARLLPSTALAPIDERATQK
jgi:hypothetical protein